MSSPSKSARDVRASPGPIADRYVVGEALGRGGFGTVFQAADTRTGQDVAIKLLHVERDRPSDRARFWSEVQAIAALRHPHTVRVFDCGVHEETPYLVMELLRGESLADRIRRTGPLEHAAAASVLRQALRAVAAMHRGGFLHRDIKPSNLFLTPTEDGGLHVTVLDFGLAKNASAQGIDATGSGDVPCSPQYVSPERVLYNASLPSGDVYALGLVGIEMLDGRRPYEAPSASGHLVLHADLALPVPLGERAARSPLADTLRRATQKRASERFHDAVEMLEAVARVDGGASGASTVSIAGQRPRPETLSFELGEEETLSATFSAPPSLHAQRPATTDAGGVVARPARSRLLWMSGVAAVAIVGIAAATLTRAHADADAVIQLPAALALPVTTANQPADVLPATTESAAALTSTGSAAAAPTLARPDAERTPIVADTSEPDAPSSTVPATVRNAPAQLGRDSAITARPRRAEAPAAAAPVGAEVDETPETSRSQPDDEPTPASPTGAARWGLGLEPR